MTPTPPADDVVDPAAEATLRRSVPLWLLLGVGVLLGAVSIWLWPDDDPAAAPASSTTEAPSPVAPTAPSTTIIRSCGPDVERSADALLVPSCGAWLGTTDRRVAGLDLALQEERLGRDFQMVRLYKVGRDEPFFTAEETRLADEGRILVYSWKVLNQPGAWVRVAGGEFDDALENAARQIAGSGHTVLFSLHHEPEDNVPAAGSNADYVAMMRHAHEVMEPIAGSQLVWFINYRGHSFGSYEQVEAMYPGDDVIDWISWNPYNWFGCQDLAEWKSFEEQAARFYQWATTEHPGKPLMIGETATNEDPADPDRKARWIADMGAALQDRYPEVRAVLWFHQSGATNFCERRWDTSPQSVDAMVALAGDPYFGG
ncbi:MAG: hypothetical protein HKN26_03220 [Acidimicrobiales bacterium]|nr:hypothetical protein [Acidimicrobiales bacterium]